LKEIVMPRLGLTQECGTILEWLKGEGDAITRGEVIAIIETDKVEQEIEAEDSGVLARILVPVGVEVDVLTPIALLK
jgi:pyruvate/2-oxoglutarate dehydrogenase complex dihydrolipoamide acyltransferase (E2) component